MDSILGKVVTATLVLLALMGGFALAHTAYEAHKTSSLVSSLATMSSSIESNYANNPAGYASLTSQVAIAAGDVPVNLIDSSAMVNPWGAAMSVGPATATPRDFTVVVGDVPQDACVKVLTETADLMGAQVGSTELTLPLSASVAAKACAAAQSQGVTPVTLSFGQVQLAAQGTAQISSISAGAAASYVYVGTGPWSFNPYGAWIWSTPGFTSSAPTNDPAVFESLVTNAGAVPESITIYAVADNIISSVLVNGAPVPGLLCSTWTTPCTYGPVNIPPGQSLVDVTAINSGGPAGLQVQIVDSSTQQVLNSTGISGWYVSATAPSYTQAVLSSPLTAAEAATVTTASPTAQYTCWGGQGCSPQTTLGAAETAVFQGWEQQWGYQYCVSWAQVNPTGWYGTLGCGAGGAIGVNLVYSCPAGYTLNSSQTQCVQTSCPAGYVLNQDASGNVTCLPSSGVAYSSALTVASGGQAIPEYTCQNGGGCAPQTSLGAAEAQTYAGWESQWGTGYCISWSQTSSTTWSGILGCGAGGGMGVTLTYTCPSGLSLDNSTSPPTCV